MHIGELIIQKDTSEETILFSPWFPREADNAVFAYEEILVAGTGVSFEVLVYHKNSEDTGEGADHGGSFSLVSNSIKTGRFSGLKEMVRFRYRVSGGNFGVDPAFVYYRMLEATWYNTEKV